MEEKGDLQNLGGDLGLPQCRFLLELSSGLPDSEPSPGRIPAQLMSSNDAINGIIKDIPASIAYGISTA